MWKLKYHNLCKCVSTIAVVFVVDTVIHGSYWTPDNSGFQMPILIFNSNNAQLMNKLRTYNLYKNDRPTEREWERINTSTIELIRWREWWQQNHNNSNKQVTYPINSYIICLFSRFVVVAAYFFVSVIVVSTLVWLFVFFLSLSFSESLLQSECNAVVFLVFVWFIFLVRLLVS